MRKKKRTVFIGKVPVGGNNPVVVQSMTKNPPSKLNEVADEINQLASVGCELIRVAVPTEKDAYFLSDLKKKSILPVVADIHFDGRIAVKAIENGADEIRINPGNFPQRQLTDIIRAAKKRKIPIRIGVNSGSLEKSLVLSASSLADSALRWVKRFEDLGFSDLKISAKSSDAAMTVKTYRILDEKSDYPLHLGVTEAGTVATGAARSAIALGRLLSDGIGDTIRVSLTGDRVDEIAVCYEILRSTGVRNVGARLVSCPTCGRIQIDLTRLAQEVQKIIERIRMPITVSVMGCAVNAIGEAKDADIAIAGGAGYGLIIKKGKIVKNVREADLLSEFKEELIKMELL
ncbi:MAG TPA: flavodoxin-dependent (E)-4-hydroxy-3-methylbut-2-enyl-diphosphate synthase [Deltaproteobacteria bacterium]|nr:flavodoxin-dependent (E)-4-hydroxy-3-methylbut-2-enyl-diphosphate synthase [Deltaproteobacteria bacterium]